MIPASDTRYTHLRDILKVCPGQELRVGLLNGRSGLATILDINNGHITASITLTQEATPPLPISLVIALPRPQTLKKVLETASTFGVESIHFIRAERTERSYFSSKLLCDENWKKYVHLGLMQGMRTVAPKVFFHENKKAWSLFETITGVKLIAHPGAKQTLLNIKMSHPIILAIGPEGGWTENEVEHFVKNGFQKISLGQTLHRVENAVCAALAQWEINSH